MFLNLLEVYEYKNWLLYSYTSFYLYSNKTSMKWTK